MSGHSKWNNIKRKKEASDAKKANIFSKLGKEITIAVKTGNSGDINVNRKLKDVVAKAKAQNMPNDNINRCIQKAIGDTSAANYEEITYEGFGPCGVSVIVEALTDNKNRAAADIRHIFSKSGGSLGQTGSVGYMFDKKGYFLIEKNDSIDEDELMLEVLDNGADDFISDEEYIEVLCDPKVFSDLLESLQEKGIKLEEAQIKQIPNIKKELTEEEKQITKKAVDGLTNDSSEELINLMKECNISDGVIMLTMLGIGTHTEYYKVLYNRIKNNKENMNDELVKKEVVDILHEIDRNEDE